MKKEIGSIFPLSDRQITSAKAKNVPFTEDKIYYSLCREALSDIALSFVDASKRVLIPAYTCQAVITPFEEAGWDCIFYPILKNLRINDKALSSIVAECHPSLVVVHPYFGMGFNDCEIATLQKIHNGGIKVVLDLTQCLFSEQTCQFADYIVGSYRKWFPIPDGGFMVRTGKAKEIRQPASENIEFTENELAAMYLRGLYFNNREQRTKDISIRLSKMADHLAENNISAHKMSQVAYNILQNEDKMENQKVRKGNFKFLFDHINYSVKVSKVCSDLENLTTAPLYFTIYVDDRKQLQIALAKESIYAPVIWPVENERVLINEEVRYIYSHLLAIPCDQRYIIEDMERVVTIINNYSA